MASSSLCFLQSPPLLQQLSNHKRVNPPFKRCRFNPIRNSKSEKEVSTEGEKKEATPFGYTRKDVLLIGAGVTLGGLGLESGLEYAGVDPLQAGNAVQLVMVLGLTVGWILSYVFRVSNKEMTYAQQLRDYEYKVMEKRLEGLTEAEVIALMEQVEEEKRQLASGTGKKI
ncbi:unnamed protein product [Rhodiola kirilowii]